MRPLNPDLHHVWFVREHADLPLTPHPDEGGGLANPDEPIGSRQVFALLEILCRPAIPMIGPVAVVSRHPAIHCPNPQAPMPRRLGPKDRIVVKEALDLIEVPDELGIRSCGNGGRGVLATELDIVSELDVPLPQDGFHERQGHRIGGTDFIDRYD